MRFLILVPLSLLLPLSACMTQRDRVIWEEFKAEISGETPTVAKAEVKEEAEAAASPSAEADVEEEVEASEAVTPPSPADEAAE